MKQKKSDLETLELEREHLYQQLGSFGDFRPGTISLSHRKCGKKNCACVQKDHLGHSQYLCTSKKAGRSVAQSFRLGPELEKAQKEIAVYAQFEAWRRQVIEINEKICRLRPAPVIEDESELETLKKKLRAKFAKR